jgi:hypothetical protein
MGIIVSMIPIVTGTLRSILIILDPVNAVLFPITGVISYGLAFTAILILFYIPTHLMLTKASRNLRDGLCPVIKLSDLDEIMDKRKNLDGWLRINPSFLDNLTAGILTPAPLIIGFLTSVLGIKI